MPRMEYSDETVRRDVVDKEMRRLVDEAITVAGGRKTPESLVIIPGRPSSWSWNEQLTLCVVNPDRVDSYMLPIGGPLIVGPTFRDKAMMFIQQFAGWCWRCDNYEAGVLVLVPQVRVRA